MSDYENHIGELLAGMAPLTDDEVEMVVSALELSCAGDPYPPRVEPAALAG